MLLDSCVSTLDNRLISCVEAATCMAIHPHGMFLLVGYEYCFRMHTVHSESLPVLNSQPISRLLTLEFTSYGNMFAVLTRT